MVHQNAINEHSALDLSDPVSAWDQVPCYTELSYLKIASWNPNSLPAHFNEALACACDVLAIQEARMSKDTAVGLSKECRKNGKQLFFGNLPMYKKNLNGLFLDKMTPGVAFIISSHISVRDVKVPEMEPWFTQGRFHALQAFVQNKWVTFFNIYAPAQQPEPMLQDLLQYLREHSHEDIIVCGDFNTDTRLGLFVRELATSRWCPLTMHTDHDFITYVHPKGGTSVIDSIIVSPSLVEHISNVEQMSIFEKGHRLISAIVTHDARQPPSWEVDMPTVVAPLLHQQQDDWASCVNQLLQDAQTKSISDIWRTWCNTFCDTHHVPPDALGGSPKFRLRDEHKLDKVRAKLQKAILFQDEESKKLTLQKLHRISKNHIRNWRNQITGKNVSQGTWLNYLFRWIRGSGVPVPSCIASQSFGVQGTTTNIADSHKEIQQYFSEIYNKNNIWTQLQHQPCEPQAVEPADYEPVVATLQKILKQLDTSKAPGIDGFQVCHFKNLCPEGIKALAIVFAAAIKQHAMPEEWLNCRVACIPKRTGKVSVKDLRPLTIAPVAYRLFCKTLLVCNQGCQQNVATDSVGGIAKRSSFYAWFPAALRCEASWRYKAEHKQSIQGVAIDTAKFFDHIPQPKACEALLHIGFDRDHVATWAHGLAHIKRFVSLNGAISKTSFCCNIGIPQGDPISMLAAAAFLGMWTQEMPRELTLAKVFVDDRLLLGNDHLHLQHLFHATEFWDTHHCFSTKDKTVAFGNNNADDNLWWLDGMEVKRDSQVVYLGIPLPLKGLVRFDFFEPIIQKCIIVLDKMINAKVQQHIAAEVIARKVIPALCHATSVARPTRDQVQRLRTKIFAAAALRQCQTQDAHSLFAEKTHVFDPDCAMIYHNLCFWNRLLCAQPHIKSELLQFLDRCLPVYKNLLGPVTLLQHDIQELDCQLQLPDFILNTKDGQQISLQDTDKQKFSHFMRDLVRKTLARKLLAKHEKWTGVLRCDINITTKLLRQMKPDNPYRNALVRLLTDAHNTPYRVYQMHKSHSPHCYHCLHEKGDIQHLLWSCPRFQDMRADWPVALQQREQWSPCALNFMIYSAEMPASLKGQWPHLQLLVTQLINRWMEFSRNKDLVSRFAPNDSPSLMVGNPQDAPTTCRQTALKQVCPLDLKWNKPNTRSKMQGWGGDDAEFNLVFTFWAKWTTTQHPHSEPIQCWLQAFLLFLRIGGHKANFVQQADFIGRALYKFRTLSMKLLKLCWMHSEQLQEFLDFQPQPYKWIDNFPFDLTFPSNLFFVPAWDLQGTCRNLSLLQAQTVIEQGVNCQIIRIPPQAFLDAVSGKSCQLQDKDLSAEWPTFRINGKFAQPTWLTQVSDCKLLPIQFQEITCISQLPLSTWCNMDPVDIRCKLRGITKRFIAAKRRYECFKKHFLRVMELAHLNDARLPHILSSEWTMDFRCHFCKRQIFFCKAPDMLQYFCFKAVLLDADTVAAWVQRFDDTIDSISSILAKLNH